ncbi:MAG: DUF1573 domain-containing protein, partial [Candidatus Bipolaricaulota bacterium]
MARTLTCLMLGLLVGGVVALAAPQIAVDLAYYDFPATIEGIAVVHTFVLSNVGDQNLAITNVYAPCGCTTTALAKTTLAPGESVELIATFDTEGYAGNVAKPVTVSSTDPLRPQLSLGFRGTVLERAGHQTSVSDVAYNIYLLIDVRDPAL